MKPCKTEAIYVIFSCLFLIGICDSVQSRPCPVVQNSQCAKCVSADNCYDSDESDGCNWCCECNPGTYVIEHCSGNDPTNTECAPCPDNTFTSLLNHQLSCNASKPPDSCIRLVNTKFVLGDSSHDNRCACKAGYFAENAEINGCKPYLECPDGFGVVRLGNATHDTECRYCEEGFCSNVTSATEECKPCNGSVSPTTSSTTSTTVTTTASAATPGGASITVEGVFLGAGIVLILIVPPCAVFLCWLRKEKLKADKQKSERRSKRRNRQSESQRKLLSTPNDYEMVDMGSVHTNSNDETQVPESGSLEWRQLNPEDVVDTAVVQRECLNEASPPDNVEMFKTKFRDFGLEVMYEPNPDNIDCIFLAIAYLLVTDSEPNPSDEVVAEKARELRQNLGRHLSQNQAISGNRTDQDWNEYINTALRDRLQNEIIIEGISRVISRHVQVIASNGSIVNRRRVNNTYGSDILIGYVDHSLGDNNYNNYYVTLHRMESEPNRGDELEDVCLRRSVDKFVNDRVLGEQQLQDRATSSDTPASDIQQVNLSQPSNRTSQNASGFVESLQQEDDSMQDSIEDAPTPSVFPEQSPVSVHHDSQDVDESTPLTQQQAEDSVHPEQANGEPDGITQSVRDDLQDVDESTAFIQQQTDDSVPPEPQPEGRTSENQTDVRQPPYPTTSTATESDTSSHEESRAAGQDQASSSQQPPTSEEVAGGTNSTQDPAATAVKVPVDERAARRMFENDLAVFKSSYNQEELKKISANPDILHEALGSSDYLEAMCDYLIDKISSSDLKAMLRSLQLLHDVAIEDIEAENPRDSREQRRLFLQKMRHTHGDDINPRILLEKTSDYSMRKPYDDLCKGFVKHFKRSNQPTTT